jgi:murein DD-endopeptidase MepM/ murein hydrolase activator NlpD
MVGVLRDELQAKQDALTETRDDYRQSKLQLEIQRNSVVDQRSLKDQLLGDAAQTQEQYQDLLNQAAREEQQANYTISALEKQAQDKLNGNTNSDTEPIYSSKGFIWPVKGPITCYFHDSNYPFQKYIGPHTGLDVGIPQGTPIRATADGTVLVANAPNFVYNTAGQKIKSALNYVSIDHGKGVASRYLHLSAVYVRSMQYVRQGEIIGLSGGLPGTAGAGTTTTGAHLHFEIRVNGLPDDPLSYLP